MELLVIDGQGGGLGRAIIEAVKQAIPDCRILAVGTNSFASNNMKKGGADNIATGENAVVYNANKASIIVGPMGIILGNSMFGEISPAMASAISNSEAIKYLIPMNQCNGRVLGVQQKNINEYINEFVEILKTC